MDKQTVVFDFDGVIHSYTSGWKGSTVIPNPPVPGIKEAIANIREAGYKVAVVSTRCISLEGQSAVENYLREHNIVVDDVCMEKPPAICYIDDRAIRFDGHPESLLGQIQNFKPWYQVDKGGVDANLEDIQIRVGEILRKLGTPTHLSGYRYLKYAIALYATCREDGEVTMKEIYWEIAKKCHTTPSRIERVMRHAVERTFLVGNMDEVDKYFEGQVEADRGKPILSQFIAVVAEYIRPKN